MRLFMMISCALLSTSLWAQTQIMFISFSMPETLLIETLRESSALQIPVVINGLIDNSFETTNRKVMALTQDVPNLQIQIDPTQFERFNIKQVPALVVESKGCFDVVYGNLSLARGLQYIKEKGECEKRGLE